MLTDLIRRFRGLGVALVVLALSAGAVFAAAPQLVPTGSASPLATDQPTQGADEDQTEAPETEEPSEAPETQEPTDAPETEAPTNALAPDATGAPQDTHGALVSAAAQMTTPVGFANHGAFVSCVAHMKDMTLATIDWTTVTPESCAAAKAAGKANHASDNGKVKSDAGKAKGQAGKAKGAAAAAAGRARH